MKLAHKDLEGQFDFERSNAWLFVIESATRFYGLISGLFAQTNGDDGNFVLSDKGRELAINGNLHLVSEPFTLDPNTSRAVLNKLLLNLKTSAFDKEYLDRTNALIGEINQWIIGLLRARQYDFEVTAGDDFSAEDLLKALKPRVELSDTGLARKLADYFLVLRDLAGIRLFALVNFSTYLAADDLAALIRQTACNEINVIFWESRNIELDIPKIYITSDLCEL